VRFQLNDSVLAALRMHRDKRHLERVTRWKEWSPLHGESGLEEAALLGRLKAAFSEGADPARFGNEYVLAMDRLQEEVENEHDAFLLEPGMGPMLYLTADGRVLTDGRSWDGAPLRAATDSEAIAALVIGADKTGVRELLELLPPCPSDGVQCPMCAGRRRATPIPGMEGPPIICLLCGGRGWAVRPMLEAAAANGTWPNKFSPQPRN